MGDLQEMKQNIKLMLLSEEHETKLQGVRQLKAMFKLPDNMFSKIKLKNLLENVKVMLRSSIIEKNLLHSYGGSLIRAIGMDPTMDAELFDHLECVLLELNKSSPDLTDNLVTCLFKDSKPVKIPAGILLTSKQTMENMILHCITTFDYHYLDILSEMSASSPKLFQTLTSILYEILVQTSGHEKVFEGSGLFLQSVKFKCQTDGKNFLGLYPRGCSQLVSYLMISPEIYAQYDKDIANVLSLLMETFLNNRVKTLIILSHFPNWIHPFVTFLKGN